jgi:hypothetical protein
LIGASAVTKAKSATHGPQVDRFKSIPLSRADFGHRPAPAGYATSCAILNKDEALLHHKMINGFKAILV